MLDDGRFPREAAIDRLRSAFGDIGASNVRGYHYQGGNPVQASAADPGTVFWGRGFGSWGSFDGNGNAATLDRTIGGVLIGADAPMLQFARVGLLGGFSRSSYDVDARQSSASSDDYHLGVYAGTTWGQIALRTGAAYSWHNIDTRRNLAFGGYSDSLRADYGARTAQVFGELGYHLDQNLIPRGASLEPFVNIAYVDLSTDAFSEKGGAASLSSKSERDDVAFMTLGLRGQAEIDFGTQKPLTARGSVGWRDAFGDLNPTSVLTFGGGSSFSIAGAPITKNAAVIEAGLGYAILPGASLDLSYGDQVGSHVIDQTVQATFDARF